jgi:hypothetical protein
MWSSGKIAAYTILFTIATISISGNIGVAVYLMRQGKFATPYTFLICWLHASLFFEEFFTLPYIFNGDDTMCDIAKTIHYFSRYINIVTVFLLIQIYRCSIFDDRYNIRKFIRNYGQYIILFTACLTFFLWLEPDYTGDELYPWCLAQLNVTDSIYLYTYYLVLMIILLISCISVVQGTYQIYKTADSTTAMRFFFTIGMYVVIAMISWLPTAIANAVFLHPDKSSNSDVRVLVYLPLYLGGILYTIIFFKDRKAIEMFEEYYSNRQISVESNSHLSTTMSMSLINILRESEMEQRPSA